MYLKINDKNYLLLELVYHFVYFRWSHLLIYFNSSFIIMIYHHFQSLIELIKFKICFFGKLKLAYI